MSFIQSLFSSQEQTTADAPAQQEAQEQSSGGGGGVVSRLHNLIGNSGVLDRTDIGENATSSAASVITGPSLLGPQLVSWLFSSDEETTTEADCVTPESGTDTDVDADEICETPDDEILSQLDDRLTRSLMDWAVTDNDARESLDLIGDLGPEQRTRVLDDLRESGQLATLLDNISEADQETYADIINTIPAQDRIDELMSTGALDWWVSEAEAGDALQIMADASDEQLATLVTEVDIETLVDSLPAGNTDELRRVYEATTDPGDRARLWGAWYDGHVDERQAEESATDEFLTETQAVEEGDEAVADFLERYGEAIRAAGDPAAAEAVRAEFAAEMDELDARKQRELDLELEYDIPIVQENVSTYLTDDQLEQIEQVYERLPASHLEGLERIERVDEEGGAFYRASEGLIVIKNGGASGNFRGTGESSELGGHAALQPLVETLTHEIGHNVDERFVEEFEEFQELAGWELLSTDEMRDALVADGMSEEDADALMETMQAEMYGEEDERVHYSSRTVHLTGDGQTLRGNKYGEGTYWQRTTNAIPGDPALTDNGLYGYANTSAGEHFAEMYTHMVNVPEMIYEDYVGNPTQALQTAQSDLLAAEQALQAARTAGASETDIAAMESDITDLQEDVADRQTQHDTLTAQWTLMREDIFGLNGEMEAAAVSGVQSVAATHTDSSGSISPDAQALLDEFTEKAAMCATPEQLDRLRERVEADLAALGTP